MPDRGLPIRPTPKARFSGTHRGLRRPARRNPKSPRSAPASRPLPAIQGLPAPIASSSRTKVSAVMSAPLAKASARATSRWGGYKRLRQPRRSPKQWMPRDRVGEPLAPSRLSLIERALLREDAEVVPDPDTRQKPRARDAGAPAKPGSASRPGGGRAGQGRFFGECSGTDEVR
jgi:hypothetical protein